MKTVALRPSMGAEELIELGQAPTAARAAVAEPARTVVVSSDEGRLLVQVWESVVAFQNSYMVEFLAYCPPERWQDAASRAKSAVKEIERRLDAGAEWVAVPADAVLRLIDLERCISAAADARLSSARLAFLIYGVGAIAGTVLGITWLSLPAYLAGLAVLFGRPLVAKLRPEPEEPYRPAIAGRRAALGDHTDKAKILERVVLSPGQPIQRHHWGAVRPAFGGVQAAACLSKGEFRVRVEGWLGDAVEPAEGWRRVPLSECDARRQIAVWSPCGAGPRSASFGPVPAGSGFEETFWIEYVGPLTGGVCRVAGPFG